MIMCIETPRMTIRDFTPEDAADLHDIFGDDETMLFTVFLMNCVKFAPCVFAR